MRIVTLVATKKSDKRNLSAKLWVTPDEHNKFFILGSNERHDDSRTVGKTAMAWAILANLID